MWSAPVDTEQPSLYRGPSCRALQLPVFKEQVALVLSKPGLLPFLRNESSLLAVTGTQTFNECIANCSSERDSQERRNGE
jgi:hypothetical protein